MAERIGTAVLELTTDASKFSAGLNDAAARLAGLTNNFKTTGTHLDVVASGMSLAGNQASASSKMIAGMSEVGRAEMERLAKATTPVHQGFSLATSTGALLKSTLGQFTIAGVASGFILSLAASVKEFVATGNKLPAVEASFSRLTASIKADSAGMLDQMRTATLGMVSNYDLMLSANKAMLLGLPVTSQNMAELAKTATVLGRAMGQDATKSLDDLITALGRSSPLILDNLGLTVKVGEANEAYAATLGKTSAQLTDAERKTAFYQAAMNAARQKTVELGDQTKTLSEHVATSWTKIGNAVSGAWAAVNVGFGEAVAKVFPEVDKFGVKVKKDVQQPVEASAQAATAAAPAFASYGAQLASVTREAASLSAEQRANIIAAKQLGVDTSLLATEFGVSAAAIAMVTAEQKKATTATDKQAEATRRAAEQEAKFWEEASRTSAELQWMWTKLQPMPAAIDSMGASLREATLASNAGRTSLLMYAETVDLATQRVSESVPPQLSAFGSLKEGVLGHLKSLWTGMSGNNGFEGLMGNLGNSIVQGFGNILSGGLSSVMEMGLKLAVEGMKKIAGAIAGLFKSDESKFVNQPRDKFFEQFGGFEGMAGRLAEAGVDGASAEQLIASLFNADDKQSFSNAQDNILAFTGGTKFAEGGFVTRPTFGLVGEAGPEVVYPLERFEKMMADGKGDVHVHVHTDTDWLRVTDKVVRHMPRSLSHAGLA